MGKASFLMGVMGSPRTSHVKGLVGRTRSLRAIAWRVCVKHRIDKADLFSPKRTREFCRPRQEVMYLARREGYSFSEIGRFMSRDHTTIMHGIKAHQQRNNIDPFET